MRIGTERPHYLPTPAQIRNECAKIRDEWSPVELRRRTCYPTMHVETQVIHAVVDIPAYAIQGGMD